MPSRTAIFRSFKQLFKNDNTYDDEAHTSMRTQKRFNEFLEEKDDLQETLEGNFFSLMIGSDIPDLDYVKKIGELDSELPGKNHEQFEEMLDYFWNRVGDAEMDFEEVLDVLCNAFPNYERPILKSAYLAFADMGIESSYEFAILLERMADYDEIDGVAHFTSDIDQMLPVELEEPVVNIRERVNEIFEFLIPYSPWADIVSLLENRFGVDHELLENFVFENFCDLYSDYSISELLMDDALNQIFRFSEGYKLFFIYAPILMRDYDLRDLDELADMYGLHIDVVPQEIPFDDD